MDRRRFVGGLAGGLVIARSVADAQTGTKVYRVGFLLGATGESVVSLFNPLREGLRELGYVEGRNIIFEQRYANGRMERLPDLAAELVRLRVDVIVTGTNLHVAAVRGATKTIPVVMVFTADPVARVLSRAWPSRRQYHWPYRRREPRALGQVPYAGTRGRPEDFPSGRAEAGVVAGRVQGAPGGVRQTRYGARSRRPQGPGRPGRRIRRVASKTGRGPSWS